MPAAARSYRAADLRLLAGTALLVLLLGLLGGGGGSPQQLAGELTVTPVAGSAVVPPGFLGVSTEYPALTQFAGGDPPDPVFISLLRDLAPGGDLSLRIGGDTTDWTWWPVPAMARPPGVRYAIGPAWVRVARAVADAAGARLMPGLNLEAGSAQLAAVEARRLLAGLGRARITAFELGNEPSLYGSFPWYTVNGRGVPGRPRSYGLSDYLSDFTTFTAQLPTVALAGPAAGDTAWTARVAEFLAAEPAVSVVTLHRYPLQHCYIGPANPHYPSIANLLAPLASAGLAAHFAPAALAAHRHGRRLRVDELNSVACGAVPAVSQSFAAALWAPDALFNLLAVGVDGVNVHTFPHAGYALFDRAAGGAWWVSQELLGLMLFAQAAPAGSHLLEVGGPLPARVRAWATQGSDGVVRVLLLNDSGGAAVRVAVRAGGGSATVLRMRGAGLAATGGATLGGQGFNGTTRTGRLGTLRYEQVAATAGRYFVAVPAASAALLSISAR